MNREQPGLKRASGRHVNRRSYLVPEISSRIQQCYSKGLWSCYDAVKVLTSYLNDADNFLQDAKFLTCILKNQAECCLKWFIKLRQFIIVQFFYQEFKTYFLCTLLLIFLPNVHSIRLKFDILQKFGLDPFDISSSIWLQFIPLRGYFLMKTHSFLTNCEID